MDISSTVSETKVALITGASRGLGLAMALMLIDKGMRVGLNYLSDASAAAVSDMADGAAGQVLLLKGDVSEAAAVSRMAEELEQKWGRLDLLINNAGISHDNLLIKTTEESWDRTMDVNLKGAFNMTQAFAPLIKNSGGGHIINISSRSALRGKAGQSAYSASKAALLGFSLSAAKELGADNIRVNAIMPGYIPTDMGNASPAAMEAAKEQSLLGTLGSVDDVAAFVRWLISTTTVTGQVFSLDSRLGQ